MSLGDLHRLVEAKEPELDRLIEQRDDLRAQLDDVEAGLSASGGGGGRGPGRPRGRRGPGRPPKAGRRGPDYKTKSEDFTVNLGQRHLESRNMKKAGRGLCVRG